MYSRVSVHNATSSEPVYTPGRLPGPFICTYMNVCCVCLSLYPYIYYYIYICICVCVYYNIMARRCRCRRRGRRPSQSSSLSHLSLELRSEYFRRLNDNDRSCPIAGATRCVRNNVIHSPVRLPYNNIIVGTHKSGFALFKRICAHIHTDKSAQTYILYY